MTIQKLSCNISLTSDLPDMDVKLEDKEYTVVLDYPIEKEYSFKFKAVNMRLAEVIPKIQIHYKKIFKEEEEWKEKNSHLSDEFGDFPDGSAPYGFWKDIHSLWIEGLEANSEGIIRVSLGS